MIRSGLIAYQWVTGLSDTVSGVLLCVAPIMTLHFLGIHAPRDAAPYVSYIGAFVLSVGVACLYGAFLVAKNASSDRVEMIWLLTAFSRGAVAIYIVAATCSGTLESAWLSIAIFDTTCVLIQSIGLRKRWIANAL